MPTRGRDKIEWLRLTDLSGWPFQLLLQAAFLACSARGHRLLHESPCHFQAINGHGILVLVCQPSVTINTIKPSVGLRGLLCSLCSRQNAGRRCLGVCPAPAFTMYASFSSSLLAELSHIPDSSVRVTPSDRSDRDSEMPALSLSQRLEFFNVAF